MGREGPCDEFELYVMRRAGDLAPFERERRRLLSIALGRDRPREAEALLRDVQRALLETQMGYDAALVSLDLAILYAQEGQTAELKRLAAEVMPAFESCEVHRERVGRAV